MPAVQSRQQVRAGLDAVDRLDAQVAGDPLDAVLQHRLVDQRVQVLARASRAAPPQGRLLLVLQLNAWLPAAIDET